MNCLLVVAVNLSYTKNFPVRPETFGTTLVLGFIRVRVRVRVSIRVCLVFLSDGL